MVNVCLFKRLLLDGVLGLFRLLGQLFRFHGAGLLFCPHLLNLLLQRRQHLLAGLLLAAFCDLRQQLTPLLVEISSQLSNLLRRKALPAAGADFGLRVPNQLEGLIPNLEQLCSGLFHGSVLGSQLVRFQSCLSSFLFAFCRLCQQGASCLILICQPVVLCLEVFPFRFGQLHRQPHQLCVHFHCGRCVTALQILSAAFQLFDVSVDLDDLVLDRLLRQGLRPFRDGIGRLVDTLR